MNIVGHGLLAPRAKAARVLVADRDSHVRQTIVGYLSDNDLNASVVSGRRALMHALSVQEPDLVVLGLHVEGEDGLDLLREVRMRSFVPVIIVAENRREEIDQVIALELGADDYLTKPFGLRELLAHIRAALQRRRMDRLSPAKEREA